MKKYFNVNLEFDAKAIEKKILSCQSDNIIKGYVCFVDLTSLVHSHKNGDFKNVLNNSITNACDGSYIALAASILNNQKLLQYTGPDLFQKFIYLDGKHLLIGNTVKVYDRIISKIAIQKSSINNYKHLELPFCKVEDFNYVEISGLINKFNPDFIWVSLGAPKQEYFMFKILPYLNRGILLGVGAAFNYFSGEIRDIPSWVKKARVIWIYRILTEPQKQILRVSSILSIFPMMFLNEIMKKINRSIY